MNKKEVSRKEVRNERRKSSVVICLPLFFSLLFTNFLPACSLLGEPSNTPPNAALSKTNLAAACEATSAAPADAVSQKAQTDAWLACTALSQVTLFCQNVRSNAPIDTELVDIILAFAPDPVLSTLGNDALDVANAAAGQWCTTQGY
jgi:hypothetical protein